MIRLLLCLLLLALPVRAEEVVADLSQDRVAISTSFDGSEILVFGAIKREEPIPTASPLSVIITIAGPREPVVVRRKDRVAGIWVNTEAAEIESAPSFYAVASTVPLSEALTEEEDAHWQISTPKAIQAMGGPSMAEAAPEFLDALIRVRGSSGAFVTAEGSVDLRDSTLFSTTIALPSALTEGNYETRIFLARDGQVVDSYATSIFVQKVGLERWIYALAHDQPLIYGLLSLFIAIAAGWLASAVFRFVRV